MMRVMMLAILIARDVEVAVYALIFIDMPKEYKLGCARENR